MHRCRTDLVYIGSISSGYDGRAWVSYLPCLRPGRTHLRERRFSYLAWQTLIAVEFESSKRDAPPAGRASHFIEIQRAVGV